MIEKVAKVLQKLGLIGVVKSSELSGEAGFGRNGEIHA